MAEAAEPAIEDTRGHALAAVIRGASVALLGSIVGGGFGFLFPVVMARVLPQSSFGQLVLALNVLLAASALGTAGADYAAIRGVAAADSPGDKRGAMRTPILFVLVLDVAVALALAGFAGPLARHVFGQPGFVWPLRALALVLPITVL